MDRRALLSLGGSLLVAQAFPAEACQTRGCLDGSVGCSIEPPKRTQFGRRSNVVKSNDRGIVGASHIPDFDKALQRVLSRLSGIFGTRAAFAYYQEAGDDKGARAFSGRRVSGTDGTILFGLNMLNHQLHSARYGDMAVLAICAHEYAHIKQFQYLSEMRSALDGYCCSKTELHADFMAGWALYHYLDEYSGTHGLQDVGRAWENLGGGSFNRVNTHGTPRQRVQAIESGYRYGRVNPDRGVMRAMNKGINEVLDM